MKTYEVSKHLTFYTENNIGALIVQCDEKAEETTKDLTITYRGLFHLYNDFETLEHIKPLEVRCIAEGRGKKVTFHTEDGENISENLETRLTPLKKNYTYNKFLRSDESRSIDFSNDKTVILFVDKLDKLKVKNV